MIHRSTRRGFLILNGPAAGFLTLLFVFSAGCYKLESQQKNKNPVDVPAKEMLTDDRKMEIERGKRSLSTWLRRNTWYAIVPSAAVAVIKDDDIFYIDTVRSTPERPYMVASLTKTFVALSVLQLADRRMLSLNDSISRYLDVDFENPELHSEKITIRHLLTHTSGLVEEESQLHKHLKMPFAIPQQKYPAGYRFNYCNQGYNLLGYLIFEVTGQSLGEYVTRNILIPLEMYDSEAPEDTRGAAGIKCSIRDLAHYIIMLINRGTFKGKRIISRRMFNEILKESVDEPESKNREYRGICWRIWTIDGEIYSMHHAAHMNGAGGYMQIFPKYNIGYIFISNPPVYDREEFYRYYYGLKYNMIKFSEILINGEFKPLDFRADRPGRKELQLFIGRYEKYNNGRHIDVTLHRDGYLIARKSSTGMNYVITPTSMHTFVYIYPGQSEKGEIFDFIMKGSRVVGLGVKDGYYVR